jgi:UbiD family decarboxylase
MNFENLRDFIKLAEEMGELRKFDGVDWDLELGGITEIMAEKEGPALLFDNIKDYPSGYRLISNVFTSRKRTALLLRLPGEASKIELLNAWRQKSKEFKPLPPVQVKTGPVLENIQQDGAVDLYSFPTPRWRENDGGRYLASGCCCITKDPDTGAINVGTYRGMIQGKNQISIKMSKGKHGRMMMEKYHSRGEPCPIAVTIGDDPTMVYAAFSPRPWGENEYDYAGWLRGRPVEVITGPVTGLPIPAQAEIVLEGEIPPLDQMELPQEGPFGEWAGYYADTSIGEVPLMNVRAVLHRNNPIIFGFPPLKPPAVYPTALPLGGAQVWEQLEKAGIPDIKGVWGFVFGAHIGFFQVISIKQRYAGHAKQALMVAAGCHGGAYGGRFVVVVDDDVDITNPQEVIWAMSTRCNVRDGIDFIKDVWTTPVDPAIPPEQRKAKQYTSDRILINACRPYSRIDSYPKVNKVKDSYRAELKNKWNI